MIECPREPDVVDAIASGRWPDRLDDDLRDHLSACAICADVAEVASAFGEDRELSWSEASAVPSAGLVWLRIQARARADATRQAERPIAIMQALGFACATGVMSVLIGVVAWWVWSNADILTVLPARVVLPSLPAVNMDVMGLAVRGVLLAVGLWLVLAPVAVYLAATDD